MTEDVALFFNLLQGNEDLDSWRTITLEAQEFILQVQEALSSWQAHRTYPMVPFQLIVLGKVSTFASRGSKTRERTKDQERPKMVCPLDGGVSGPGRGFNRQNRTICQLDQNCEHFVIGDTAHTPSEIEIAPETIKGGLNDLIHLACCPQPPFYLAEGQIITQAIPVPTGVPVDDKTPDAYWAEVVGEDKPVWVAT
ncbi:hypothetical protein DUI87_15841 [Hirundo rustica rustica]|uniref:Uncharacterized protein n=1 Tax=Hirundo rustica rustica TaxID=333673 RepID=A0A3M0KGZ4_HIRRU|nr:hypothetical protein DUI87_15841 [Hirundo rustica rustica]